jgi:4-amino-4-deoxy-L-arabinose transferase-like glycosyltransferase
LSTFDLPLIKGNRARWLVLLLIASLPLVGWWSYGLFDLDEGFYAAVTGSMIRHGEWITPLYNGQPWFEKPILIYWLSKPAVMLFGQDFGPRLPSVLATIATYAVVVWFVRRRVDAMPAVLSLFILGSSLLVVALGRLMMTDSLLLLFYTAAMLTYYESLIGSPKWKLVTAASLGFAVLAKGPVAILLFVLIAGSNAFFNRKSATRESQSATIWPLGSLMLLAIVASWYVPAYLASGQEFVDEFLIKQNIGRFTGGDQAHTLPLYKSFWFYIPVLLLGMFPWILWLPNAITNKVSMRDAASVMGADTHLRKYCVVWLSVIFLFFTLSGAKLPHYILPCCPPIAILVAIHLAQKWKGLSREQILPKLSLTIAWLATIWIIAHFGFKTWYVRSGQQEAHQMAKSMRETPGRVAVYQLSRRKGVRTGSLEIQETSLPSLSFYFDQDLIEAKDLQTLDPSASPIWVFTRVGRISLDQVDEFDRTSTSRILLPRQRGKYYEAFSLTGSEQAQ